MADLAEITKLFRYWHRRQYSIFLSFHGRILNIRPKLIIFQARLQSAARVNKEFGKNFNVRGEPTRNKVLAPGDGPDCCFPCGITPIMDKFLLSVQQMSRFFANYFPFSIIVNVNTSSIFAIGSYLCVNEEPSTMDMMIANSELFGYRP